MTYLPNRSWSVQGGRHLQDILLWTIYPFSVLLSDNSAHIEREKECFERVAIFNCFSRWFLHSASDRRRRWQRTNQPPVSSVQWYVLLSRKHSNRHDVVPLWMFVDWTSSTFNRRSCKDSYFYSFQLRQRLFFCIHATVAQWHLFQSPIGLESTLIGK